MGKKGKRAQAGRGKKVTFKYVGKKLDTLVKKLEEELEGADLFQPIPPTEDCPICCIPLSRISTNCQYHTCCGKRICLGCVGENDEHIKAQNEKKAAKNKPLLPDSCPFCRSIPNSCEQVKRQLELRAQKNDAFACFELGRRYLHGSADGYPVDEAKGLDCLIRAVDLGSAEACFEIAECYGEELSVDGTRIKLFLKIGALRGCIESRNEIGKREYIAGNFKLSMHHWRLSAEGGNQSSLNRLKGIYNGNKPGKEFITKDDLDWAYRVCHEAQMEFKSESREKYTNDPNDMRC